MRRASSSKNLQVMWVLLLSGACVALACLHFFTPGEKDAVYLFGHWFDVTWELLVPAGVAGVLFLAASCFWGKR